MPRDPFFDTRDGPAALAAWQHTELLNADNFFSSEVQQLFIDLDRLIGSDPPAHLTAFDPLAWSNPDESPEREWWEYQLSTASDEAHEHLEARRERARRQFGADRAVRAFAARWHLPSGNRAGLAPGPHEVYESWRFSRNLGHRPELLAPASGGFIPTPGIKFVTGWFERDGTRVKVTEQVPVIFPSCPLPFRWDPVSETRADLNQKIDILVNELRDSIRAQAAEFERQLEEQGWPLRSRRPPERVLRSATHFYRVFHPVHPVSRNQIARELIGSSDVSARALADSELTTHRKIVANDVDDFIEWTDPLGLPEADK